MGAHFNVAMRAMKHIQLYTYHVHALSKCVLALNGRFRWQSAVHARAVMTDIIVRAPVRRGRSAESP